MRVFKVALALCLLWACGALRAADILVVSAESSLAFAEAREALESELRSRGVGAERLRWLTASDLRLGAGYDGNSARLVVAMGADALRGVISAGLRSPVLATFVPRTLYERILREAPQNALGPISAIYLDQPLSRQFDLIRLALPQARRISVLLGPESSAQQAWLASSAAVHKLELAVANVGSSAALSFTLQSVLEGADVFLALPDTLVFNNSSIASLLLSSYRAQVPMVAFSPAYVKAGALLALHSTPAQIGAQTATAVRSMLDGDAGRHVSHYPNTFTVSVNPYVARSLNINVDAGTLTERLRRLEAKP